MQVFDNVCWCLFIFEFFTGGVGAPLPRLRNLAMTSPVDLSLTLHCDCSRHSGRCLAGCVFLANSAFIQASVLWVTLTPLLYSFHRYARGRWGEAVAHM